MRAVMPEVPPDILAWRKRTGADRWDEMWEGTLHTAPSPNREHQGLLAQWMMWLDTHWAEPLGNEVLVNVNVASIGGWPNDYRIPDLILLTPDCSHIDRGDYFEGAPAVVIEIRSPGDETIEKLPFYARIGVPEVWILDGDSRVPQILCLVGGNYQELPPDVGGWLRSPGTDIGMRAEPNEKFATQLGDDFATRKLLPKERRRNG